MGEELAFIIRAAPAVNPPIADGRLEGRGIPGFQGLWRLNIEMPIDQQCTPCFGIEDLAVD